MAAPVSAHALPYVALNNAFTPTDLDHIEQFGDRLTAGKATIADKSQSKQYADLRVTQTAWIQQNGETARLYEQIGNLVRVFNERFFQFDLRGFSDPFQYTIYRTPEGGHYDWHVDHGADSAAPRKLSLSLQLTDPSRYEGCDLQMYVSNKIETAPRDRGTLIAFPSYVLHRVTPIRSGTRKSLVIWANGPKFV